MLNNGEVYKAAPGSDALTAVTGFPVPTGGTELIDVVATDTEVFILRKSSILRCTGTCATFSDFAVVKTLPFPDYGWDACARGSAVFVTVNANNIGGLYAVDRTGGTPTFTQRSSDLGVGSVKGCHVAESGDVYIAGDTGVVVLRTTGGVGIETVNLAGQANAGWWSVVTRGTGASLAGFLVGGGSGYRSAVRQGASWLSLTPITTGGATLLSAVVALTGGDVLAGGTTNGTSATPGILQWDGAAFSGLTPAAPLMDVACAAAGLANDVYFGGNNRTPGNYAVVHGTR